MFASWTRPWLGLPCGTWWHARPPVSVTLLFLTALRCFVCAHLPSRCADAGVADVPAFLESAATAENKQRLIEVRCGPARRPRHCHHVLLLVAVMVVAVVVVVIVVVVVARDRSWILLNCARGRPKPLCVSCLRGRHSCESVGHRLFGSGVLLDADWAQCARSRVLRGWCPPAGYE